MSIISCEKDMAFSLSQRICRPLKQLPRGDFYEYMSGYTFTDSSDFHQTLTACPSSLQGNYAYPFNAGYFVSCENGRIQVESCPRGTFYSLSKHSCSTGQQLAIHEFLDYSYTSVQLSSKLIITLISAFLIDPRSFRQLYARSHNGYLS